MSGATTEGDSPGKKSWLLKYTLKESTKAQVHYEPASRKRRIGFRANGDKGQRNDRPKAVLRGVCNIGVHSRCRR
jgi:hypothetical protein